MTHRTLAILVLLFSLASLAQEDLPTATASVDQQIRLLQESKRASVRRQAIVQLSGEPGREINEVMLEALKDRDAGVRAAAIYHLRDARWPIPIADLRRASRDRNANVRAAAIWTLMTLHPAQYIGIVSAAFGDSAPDVRTAAIWAAGQFSQAFEPELSTQVIKLFDRCFSKECNAIIWVLLKHRDRLPDSVRSRLLDKLSVVRTAAAEAIGASAAYAELETLSALAVDSVPSVRAAAASALGILAGNPNDRSTEALLLRLLGDEIFAVRHAAADALEHRGFVAPKNILSFVEDKTDDTPWVAHVDRTSIAPTLMKLWEDLQGAERRRLARLLMTWHYEPAVEAGLALVASRSLLDRMTGWRGLIAYRNSAYLSRAALATLASPFTWLYILLIAALITWAIWIRKNLRGAFSKDHG